MKKKQIMVVEDERVVADDIRMSLQRLGYGVSAVASSAQDAIKQAEKTHPDLVLMDIVLDGEDGIEVAGKIRSRFNIPVVFLTAYADDKTLERVKLTEPVGYILKPFEDRELLITIEIALYTHEVGKKLKESEEKYRKIFELSPEIIGVLDKKGNIVDINRMVYSWLGYKPEEFIGKNFFELSNLVEKNRAQMKERFDSEIFGKEVPAYDVNFITKAGEKVVGSVQATPIKDENGKVVREIIMISDITERKKMEEKLGRILEELKRKNLELDDYTYTVSHDLKAPLITIQGFSEMLYEKYRDILDESGSMYLERITLASKRLDRFVSDLLKLSRAGRRTEEFKEENIKSIVETSIKSLDALIREKQIEVKYGPKFPAVFCDKTRIIQVFDNLIVNAIKYIGKQEKPKIEIGWRELKKHYKFWIADNGMGIRERDKERIFKVFYRGSGVGSEEGTGVGLAVAKKVIESHDGEIWVDSKPGKGATFYFTIPKPE